MQSTLNTAAASPARAVRPKIGRPPPLVLVPRAPEAPPAPPAPPEALSSRWNARLIVLTVCLVLGLTLGLSRILPPSLGAHAPGGTPALKDAPPIPPLVHRAPPLAEVPPPQEGATPADRAIIDGADRQRLLSILSKD